MTLRRLALASLVVVAASALAGCDDDRRAPGPPTTPSPTPDTAQTAPGEQIDPRCLALYPADAALVHEGEIGVRPLGWPAPPEFAVLCRIERISPVEARGYYAMTDYTSFDKVMWYYEHAFTAGEHGRAPTADGEVLTGVLGDASYYIESGGKNRFHIDWALDGDYAE